MKARSSSPVGWPPRGVRNGRDAFGSDSIKFTFNTRAAESGETDSTFLVFPAALGVAAKPLFIYSVTTWVVSLQWSGTTRTVSREGSNLALFLPPRDEFAVFVDLPHFPAPDVLPVQDYLVRRLMATLICKIRQRGMCVEGE
jgi:hypothetical protein